MDRQPAFRCVSQWGRHRPNEGILGDIFVAGSVSGSGLPNPTDSYLGGSSDAFVMEFVPGETTTTLTATPFAPAPFYHNEPVTLTATVTANDPYSGVPAGDVKFERRRHFARLCDAKLRGVATYSGKFANGGNFTATWSPQFELAGSTGSTTLTPVDAGPTVTNVLVGSTTWSSGFTQYLASLSSRNQVQNQFGTAVFTGYSLPPASQTTCRGPKSMKSACSSAKASKCTRATSSCPASRCRPAIP